MKKSVRAKQKKSTCRASQGEPAEEPGEKAQSQTQRVWFPPLIAAEDIFPYIQTHNHDESVAPKSPLCHRSRDSSSCNER